MKLSLMIASNLLLAAVIARGLGIVYYTHEGSPRNLDAVGQKQPAQLALAEWQQNVDTAFGKAAALPQLPESRAVILAERSEFQALLALDRRLGTSEAQLFPD